MDKFEVVDKFRDTLMDRFLQLCDYNDYNELTLLIIGDVVNDAYNECIEEMVGDVE